MIRSVLIAIAIWLSSVAAIDLPIVEENQGIVVRAEKGLEGEARRTAKRAPDTLRAIYTDLGGLPRPARIEIRLVKRAADLPEAAPPGRGAPAWAEGVAYPDLGIVSVAYRRGAEMTDLDSVVDHELAHLALGAALEGRAPRWLNEGFAYLHSSEWSMGRMRTLTGLAWTGNVIPLSEIDRHFPAGEIEVDRAYAQSYDFVAFLARRGMYADPEDDGNRWPFQEFLAGIARGQSPNESARMAYGATLQQLFDEWYVDLRDRYLLVPGALVGLSIWVLCAILLVIGYLRKRRQSRAILARWEREERARDQALEG